MRKFLLLSLCFLAPTLAYATTDMTACTREYAPVCAQAPMPECPKGMMCAQVMPSRQTYSNACVAKNAGATDVVQGACTDTLIVGNDSDIHGCKASAGYTWNSQKKSCTRSWEDDTIVGNDSDIHGCKASAGYRWNNTAGKCLRPWESRIRVLTIGSKTVSCMGVMPMQCMQIRSGFARWENFYGNISGFDYVPGYTYRLQVLETKVENPPADASHLKYELIRVLSEKPTRDTMNNNPIRGAWQLESYNSKNVSGKYTLNIESDTMFTKFCNNMNGSYKLLGNRFVASGFMRTLMYCEGESMMLEDNFDISGATYSLIQTKSFPAQNILTITTKIGNTYIYKN